jgi:oxygen-dependent protoporphyrinogen oxidase
MIGRLDPSEKSATIVGAGISGLLMGYALKKKGYQVRILERSNRAGGLIETKATPSGPAETAAHSLMVTPEIDAFFKDLGVSLSAVNPSSRARYIYRNGKMRKFPLTFRETIHTLIRFFSSPLKPIDPETATLAEWCEAYLGKPALQYLLSPFVTGVYAASPEELLLKSAFPRLVPSFPEKSLFKNLFSGSRKKTLRPQMMAPTLGMGQVVSKLTEFLSHDIAFKTEINSLPDAKNLILCVPTPELAALIREVDPNSFQALQKIHYSPIITCTVFAPDSSFDGPPPRGVGVLIPRGQGLRILGVLFNSSSFPERVQKSGHHSFTVMLGGTQDPEILNHSDAQLTDLISQDLFKLFQLSGPIESIEITRWRHAIPVYSKALSDAQSSLAQGFCGKPGRLIYSNFSKDVSLRGLIQTLDHLE